MRIVVTGGSGKAGRWVVRDLREHGHDVLNVDRVRDGGPYGRTLVVDLTDLGQCYDVLPGDDAVVHLAAIPAPGLQAEGETFRDSIISTSAPGSCSATSRSTAGPITCRRRAGQGSEPAVPGPATETRLMAHVPRSL